MTNLKLGLITPFNSTPEERRIMYTASPPTDIVLAACLLQSPDFCEDCAMSEYERVHDKFVDVMHECTAKAPSFGISSHIILTHGMVGNLPAAWIGTTPEQNTWQVKGLYMQAAFIRLMDKDVDEASAKACINMTIYDRHAGSTYTLDPALHPDIPANEEAVHAFSALTGDMYRDGTGLLTPQLLSFRDMVMVKGRAVQCGLSPNRQYERFLKEGGRYCLEAPQL